MNIDKLNTRDAVRAGYWAVLALADRLDHEYTADGAAALAGQVLAAGHALTVLGEDPAPEVDPEVGALVEEGLREKVAEQATALEAARAEVERLRNERDESRAMVDVLRQVDQQLRRYSKDEEAINNGRIAGRIAEVAALREEVERLREELEAARYGRDEWREAHAQAAQGESTAQARAKLYQVGAAAMPPEYLVYPGSFEEGPVGHAARWHELSAQGKPEPTEACVAAVTETPGQRGGKPFVHWMDGHHDFRAAGRAGCDLTMVVYRDGVPLTVFVRRALVELAAGHGLVALLGTGGRGTYAVTPRGLEFAAGLRVERAAKLLGVTAAELKAAAVGLQSAANMAALE